MDSDKYRHNSKDDNDMKVTYSFSKMTTNEVSSFMFNGNGHLAKISPNKHKKNRHWCKYCKSQTHKRKLCRYKRRDTIKKAVVDYSSFVFKINDQPLKTLVHIGLLVDAEATSHIKQNDIRKFWNFYDSFQPDNHFIELADRTRTKGEVLKRDDTEIGFVDMDGNHVTVSQKGALYILSYPQNIFFVKSTTANGVTMTFKKNENELVYWNGTKFKIHVDNWLYYLISMENKSEDSCHSCYDIHIKRINFIKKKSFYGK